MTETTLSEPSIQPQALDHSHVWANRVDRDQMRRDIAHQLFEKRRFYEELLYVSYGCGARRILEAGAGTALDSFYLAERSGAEHHAFDIADTAIELGKRIGEFFTEPVTLYKDDALATRFEGGSFDMIFHQGLLEHFEDPTDLLTENLRLLRPGGFLVVDVPQRFSLYTLMKRRKMERGDWPWGWEREYTARQMKELTRGRPMELVRLSAWGYDHYSGLVRWPWLKLQRRNPWRDTTLFKALDRAHSTWIEPIWESSWRILERIAGPYFMMNVTGIYRRIR